MADELNQEEPRSLYDALKHVVEGPHGILPATTDEVIADDLHDLLDATGKHVLILNTTAESLQLLAENEDESRKTAEESEKTAHRKMAKCLRKLAQAIEDATRTFEESEKD